ATRPGCLARPRPASAAPRPRTPRRRTPRRAQSRRGNRLPRRGRGSTRRGRPAQGWWSGCLAHDRPYFDAAAEPECGDARGHLCRLVEVVRLVEVIAAEDLLGVCERPVGDQRLAV